MRACKRCDKDETQTRFYPPASISGISTGRVCAPCWIAKSVEWRRKNRDRWNAQNHRKTMLRKFGITYEQYDKLYANPSCYACGKTETKNSSGAKRMVLDHDHKTGKLRGMLCHSCNMAISFVGDNPVALRRLADYLERDSCFD